MKILETVSDPVRFRHGRGNNPILSLSAGAGDRRLLTKILGNKSQAKKNNVTRDGATIISITSLIDIRIGIDISGLRWRYINTMVGCFFMIPKDTFNCLPVNHRGIGVELSELISKYK